jgi:hypothetical protein
MPSKISANNGPVTFIHQKEYLIAVERNISKKGQRREIMCLSLRQKI